jgi:DNA-binding Lrp family transcriptional regulator
MSLAKSVDKELAKKQCRIITNKTLKPARGSIPLAGLLRPATTQQMNEENIKNAFKQDGMFAENIRASIEGDDTELRESMQTNGWINEFPALVDERGITLVGHRRIKIAKELGIAPVIKQLVIGDGDEADATRFRLAIVSNIGFKPMTKEDRQRIAEYLYGEREWTMQRIADALNVGKATIYRDLNELSHDETIKPAKTASNPKGAGRPKGVKSSRKPSAQSEYRDKVIELYDAKVTLKEIAKQTGVSFRNVRDIIEKERIRRKGVKDATADIKITRDMLSITALEKLDRAVRQEKERLSREFKTVVAQQVNEDIKLRLDGISERWHAEQDLAKRILHARKGFMPKKVYRLIISCLHPDKFEQIVNLISSGKLGEIDSMKAKHSDAFRMFKQFEKFILDEKESPTTFVPLPRTMEEWAARKAQVIAERKAAKAAKKVDLSPTK